MGRKQWSKWGRGNNIKHQKNKKIKKETKELEVYDREKEKIWFCILLEIPHDVTWCIPYLLTNTHGVCLHLHAMCGFLSRHQNTYTIISLIIPQILPINTLPDMLLLFSSKSSRFNHAYNNGLTLKKYRQDVLKFVVVFVFHISILRARLRHCFEKQSVWK